MNIFILDKNPLLAARYQCDKHVVKMCLETAQLLCSAFSEGTAPYRRTHYNHPCSKWVRGSEANFIWLVNHGRALCNEYTLRYGKIHKSESVIEWCARNQSRLSFYQQQLTPFPRCIPDDCKHNSTILSYRKYYITHKKAFARWNHGPKPWWWEEK